MVSHEDEDWSNYTADVTDEDLAWLGDQTRKRCQNARNPLHHYLHTARVLAEFNRKRIAGTPLDGVLYPADWVTPLSSSDPRGLEAGETIEDAGIIGMYDWISKHGSVSLLYGNDLVQEHWGIDAVGQRADRKTFVFYESKGTTRSIRSASSYLKRTRHKGRQLSWLWCWRSLTSCAVFATTAELFVILLQPFLEGHVERCLVVSGVAREPDGFLPDGRHRVWAEMKLRGIAQLDESSELKEKRSWLAEIPAEDLAWPPALRRTRRI